MKEFDSFYSTIRLVRKDPPSALTLSPHQCYPFARAARENPAMECPKCHTVNPSDSKFCKECATPLPSSAESDTSDTETIEIPTRQLSTGSTFAGRYQVIEELGKGGMGQVYKVFDTKIKEKVALKLIKPEIASHKDTIERFGNEIRLARRIGHRNVCKMFDLGEAEGAHFITMEYVHGEDLKSMIHMSGSLSIGMLLNVGKQVCDGLTEAHSLGVVHRDLKPQNIMIDKNGNAKIMDFGIARSLRDKGITDAGIMIGTPEYMSPEQAEAKDVDHRSDIYSLGIILYEMATSRVPFEGETALGIAMKHKGETPISPKQLNPHIPDDLNGVILKCLEKDKAKRYQSAADVRSELEKIERGIPTTERVVPERKPITSKEITVKLSLRKLLIPTIVVAALLIAAVIVIWRVIPRKAAAPAASVKHSIAVLPFQDLSPKKDYEYLCEGIPETLINALTRIKGLYVPARASAFSFKGKEHEIGEIGRKLNVDTVLRGSVQVIGDRLRITSQLINEPDGSYLWSNSYDRKLEDVFAIQDEMAREIVKALKITLLGEKEAPLVKSYTESLEAYNLYLQGRYFWNKRTADDVQKAVGFFNQAIEKDPNYALAYVGLSDSYVILPLFGGVRTKELVQKAQEAVSKALAIDDTLAEAHTSLASIKELQRDIEGAEREYKRAIELNPNYPTAHQWYSSFLEGRGRIDEALAEMKRAQELDPLSLIINASVGGVLYDMKQYDQAIEQCRKTLELDPNFAVAHWSIGLCYRQKGMYKEAIDALQKARNLFGNSPVGLADLGNTYAMSGDRAKAMEIIAKLKELSKQGYPLSYDIALVYCGLGEKDKAFEYLEKACDERAETTDWQFYNFKYEPVWESLRSDPRYASILKRMKME